MPGGTVGGASSPTGSLAVSFVDVRQGDRVLVQAGDENCLIDAGTTEEGPRMGDFLRSRGVKMLDGILVTKPRNSLDTGA